MKRGQQQQYIQGFFKKKPCQRQVDEVQCRSEPIHPAGQVGQQIRSPEPGSTGQSWSERASEDYNQQPSICKQRLESQNMKIFYKKSLDTHTHTHTHHTHRLFGQSKLRTSIVWSVVFIYKKRDELSRHLCSAFFMWLYMTFPMPPPPWLVLGPPLCHPIKKILESPLLEGPLPSSGP